MLVYFNSIHHSAPSKTSGRKGKKERAKEDERDRKGETENERETGKQK